MKKHLSILFVLLTACFFGNMIASFAPAAYNGMAFLVAFSAAAFFGLFVKLPAGTLASTPAATAGGYSAEYISLQDIGMPKWYSRLVNQYGDQGAEFVGMIQAMGWSSKTDVKLIQHYEDDWIWDSFMVESQAGGGATATLTISAASILNGRFFPIVGDIIEFPNKDASGNAIQARVETVGANTIAVRVAKSGWTIPATTTGQTLIVGTNLSAEGTGQPASKRTTFNLYQNTFARVKSSVDMTGDAMTEALKWQEYELIDGRKVTGIVSQTSLELDFKQMKAEQYTMLSGQRYDNITQDGKSIEGTEGMFAAMQRASIPFPYTTFGMSSFDAIEKSLSSVYAGQISGFLQGIDLDITTENVLVDYFKFTDIDYKAKTANTQLFGEDEGLAQSVNFKYLEKAKRMFAFKRWTSMQDPKQYGAVGYDYTGRGVIFPLKKNNVDPNTKAKIPTIRTVYRALDGYDRQKEMFTTGSANVAKYGNTNDVDNRVLNCRSHFGPEFFALAQWVNLYQN